MSNMKTFLITYLVFAALTFVLVFKFNKTMDGGCYQYDHCYKRVMVNKSMENAGDSLVAAIAWPAALPIYTYGLYMLVSSD